LVLIEIPKALRDKLGDDGCSALADYFNRVIVELKLSRREREAVSTGSAHDFDPRLPPRHAKVLIDVPRALRDRLADEGCSALVLLLNHVIEESRPRPVES